MDAVNRNRTPTPEVGSLTLALSRLLVLVPVLFTGQSFSIFYLLVLIRRGCD